MLPVRFPARTSISVHVVLFATVLLAWLAPPVLAASGALHCSCDAYVGSALQGGTQGTQAPAAGSITGVISDPDGRPVSDADVLLTQAATVVARARTDTTGRYTVANLPAGRYEIHVALEGFRADPQAVAVHGGDALAVDVRMRLSAVSESVLVSASQLDV